MAFTASAGAQDPETIFLSTENQTVWHWFGGTKPPASNWQSPFFFPRSDPDWDVGVTPFGYGEPFLRVDNGTLVPEGRFISLFLRLEFKVDFPERVLGIDLTVFYDDGLIAYLNGQEIGRQSLPLTGPIGFATAGFDHEFTESPFQRSLTRESGDLDALIPGTNVLSFSLHNSTIGSSDLVFRHNTQAFQYTFLPPPPPEFIRGTECDGIDSLDIGDAVYALRSAMGQVNPPGCMKACDMDDNASIEMTDGVYALMFMFTSGLPFPAPYPASGVDPTDDDLTCISGRPEF